ncbi:helix-turn-helix transcriptional regulator [Neisseria weaveri]|uniref:Putative prophage regulator protein n=1 Tax=Neisseria weaveri TaxID=28091 RepID=A0A3S4ZCN2_9NEIS|nr:AlpA family phage regulatory protein [Neisseria weaveri]EGV38188.1 putative prophage regulatory protein [Neisseria weaveri ATCC 51223]SAY51582.1 putative prophage regulator protein [Neisseria weaveri]VEJ50773.1 putative prophage regulator protein [Neisseria weaveri]
MELKVIRVQDVAERLGISASAVWYKTNPKHRLYDPAFPRPFKVSANVTGWLDSEISAYIEKLAERRKETA